MYIFKIRNVKKTETCINSYVPILEKTKKMFVFRGIYDKAYRNKPKNQNDISRDVSLSCVKKNTHIVVP